MTATEKLTAVNEGKMTNKEFVRQMRQAFPQYISNFNGFKDTVQILKNKGLVFEAKKESYDSVATPNPLDKFRPSDVDRGLRVELQAMGLQDGELPTEEEHKKAEAQVLKNLEKDAMHYLNMVSGESKNVDKHDQMTAVKSNNHKDTFNQMKKADLREGIEAPEGNIGVDKREAFKLAAQYLMSHHKIGGEEIKTFLRTHGDDILGMSYQELEDEYQAYLGANPEMNTDLRGSGEDYMQEEAMCPNCKMTKEACKCDHSGVYEKEGTDYDEDGDVDDKDYMHAKDKAIKKAMGKDESAVAAAAAARRAASRGNDYDDDDDLPDLESSKFGAMLADKLDNFIQKVRNRNKNEMLREGVTKLVQKVLSEAHTAGLQRFIDGDADSEVTVAAKDLMEVIESLEKEFLKHKDKIQASLEKAGPFMAPALEKAFKGDLASQRQSFESIKSPSTPKLTPDQMAQIDQAKAAGTLGEMGAMDDEMNKETVFTPRR